jgi:hypothetical protein
MARNSGSSFVAYGNANYVAGAMLGNAIGEAIRAKQNFNDCMTMHGWLLSTSESGVASQAIVVAASPYHQDFEADARGQAANACHASGINANDKGYYDCFQSHFTALMTSASKPDH